MKKLVQALQKMVAALEAEKIDYMLVGGFAMSYYNRYRLTLDFDCVVQMWPHDIERLVAHFPEWKEHLAGFRDTAELSI